ncbi:hypothetical protein RWV98_05760 [Agathobaculum sp. NTUH-O15-33]|uniref:hypothetical protein n=1 Tax=Agathobaculum sp. NTUH-O15-33 TaxID=3079302 RepID=UPI00295864CC|nr:hypothetical protein [Agathobaculum sp. NTUH-O15-33]WNX85773.1 hypothetical protein RWV98_05760 [Agathobaculum sp. NTUH-O15-33]
MKTLEEMAEEYERNLVPLRRRRDALREKVKHVWSRDERNLLWRRIGILDGMITSSAQDIAQMRGDAHGI